MIADTVKKNLNRFEEAVKAQDLIKNQVGVLEKQYVASVLAGVIDRDLLDEHHHPGHIKALREETLLQVFDDDETYYPTLRYKAAEVLAARKSPRLIPPLLNLLNSLADSDLDVHDRYTIAPLPTWTDAVKFLAYMHTPEAYEGLKKFLNYLLTDNPKSKDWFLEETVSSLVQVGIKLNMGDSVPILRRAIPYLNNPPLERESLGELAIYFDIFNEPVGIKEILSQPVTGGMSDVEVTCLKLLKKHDPRYVEEWIASRKNDG